jgi:hypothetical protein
MSDKQNKSPRGSKTIRIPCTEEEHNQLLKDRKLFRPFIESMTKAHPELFPSNIAKGYYLHGFVE